MRRPYLSQLALGISAILLFVTQVPAQQVLTRKATVAEAPWEFEVWTPLTPGPVFQGAGGDAWDAKIRERGWILLENGRYRLWYTGYNDAKSSSKFLGLATSPDGLHWTRDPANPVYHERWTEDVCVVPHNDLYIMFAEGKGDIAHQLSSPDGVKWTDEGDLDIRLKNGTPITPGPRGTPFGFYANDLWNLIYERYDRGVWLACSPDRKVWTNVQDEPLLVPGPEKYDAGAIAINQVVKRGSFYYAFYHANVGPPSKIWTTCLARSKDLLHWEKSPRNPIISEHCSSAVLVTTPDGDRLYTMHPEVRVFVPKKAK